MAANQEATISLRIWVDEKQSSVIVAEASGDFVNVLFSFLTLPLGTIIRLLSENQPWEIGCIDNLYQSVKKFDKNVFWNRICGEMLLSPRNPSEASCQRLKLKVDDTLPTKYFVCGYCLKGDDFLLSTFAGVRCFCGRLMSKEMKVLEESKEEGSWGNDVFVKGDAMFLIFDDLRVLHSSPGNNTVQQLLQLGYRDLNKMKEVSVNVGMKEIFSLLKQALTSKSPLSDVFLENRKSEPTLTSFSPDTGPSDHRCSLKLKITVSKRQNKILFAEAGGNVVDFLFSFLTIPLGSILNLMNDKLSLGSIDNLYTSVKDLNSSWFIGSAKNSLLNPCVPHQFGCTSQPIHVPEDTPSYWYGTKVVNASIKQEVISKNQDMLQDPVAMKIFEPRCSDGAREPAVGFMKRPCLFVLRDDLQVTPMATTSSISFLQELHLPLDDFEEHLVEIKNSREALNLLRASLTSKAALTHSLFYLLKKRKREMCILGCLRWKEERNEKTKDGKRKEKDGENREMS